ncbi:MAG: hypothetical protein NVSMB44_45020 [Ktedonobacteraceae bacterium]
MRNIFSVFGSQNSTNNGSALESELNEQDLELVNGASGSHYCYEDDDDCYRDCEDDDDYSCEHHHRHHRHHC